MTTGWPPSTRRTIRFALVGCGPRSASHFQTLTAPALTLADVEGRTLMIHENGDNYSNEPKPLGGGGARIACGVIPGEPAAKPTSTPAGAPTPAAPTK